MIATVISTLRQPTAILPLVVFRIVFGVLMFISTLRFTLKGWIHEFYIAPEVHFPYLGLEWITPLPGDGMYIVFGAMLLLTTTITVGLFYRVSVVGFFLLFTYVELLDKTYYLNHYYFISLLSFLLIFLPLHRAFSLDVWRNPDRRLTHVPRWTIAAIQFQLGVVYFFAGVAKLKPDWLLDAMPLTIWLRANVDFPVLGQFFDERWLHFAMSWAGAAYDLTIPFLLLWNRSRPIAYLTVIAFHVMTALLFPIGMFPWIMIALTPIFFSAQAYGRVLGWLKRMMPLRLNRRSRFAAIPNDLQFPRWAALILAGFFAFQVTFPLRHWLYPGDVMWTEEGYRFAWNVMLAEKSGLTIFRVHDNETGREWLVFPNEYLSPQQEHQMSFQPDMILQFAHYLEDEYAQHGHDNLSITVDAYVSLNGRSSQRLIQADVDLTQEASSLHGKDWITRP
jgi:hypothetical protein